MQGPEAAQCMCGVHAQSWWTDGWSADGEGIRAVRALRSRTDPTHYGRKLQVKLGDTIVCTEKYSVE